jgi:phage/plasmid-like protein (TIGR03299 family)
MFYSGETPWHRLGTYVGDLNLTSSEAIVKAGLDWDVNLQIPYILSPTGEPIEVEGYKSVVRITDDKPLSIVGGRYTPVQNRDAFEFFDSVVGEKRAIYHTAGSLDSGRKIWILAKLPRDIVIRISAHEDITQQFLLFTNSHDGTSAVRMLFTPIRVVCNNTLNMALTKSGGVNIRHTQKVHNKIKQAQEILGFAIEYYKDFSEIAQKMANTSVTSANFDQYLNELFNVKEEEETATRTENMIYQVKEIHEKGTVKPFSGTVWGVYNAVTEFSDHFKTVKGKGQGGEVYANNVLDSIWFGSGARLKQKAFDLALEMVK